MQHRLKSPHDVNSIATVDRKIGQIKKAISGAMMEEEMSKVNLDWAELMPDIVKGLNEAPTEALRGKAPEDIKSEDAIFDVLKQNAEKQEKAEDKFHKQVDAVEKSSKVRTLMRDSQKEKGPMGPVRRSFLPTFSGMPQTVTKFETGLSETERKN